AFYATLIMLLITFLESRHCMGVSGVFPDIVFMLMATGAFVDSHIRGRRAEQAQRSSRSLGLRLLGGLALFISEFGVSTRDFFHRRWVIRYRVVERNISIDLIIDLAVALQVYTQFAQVFGLAVGVSDRGPIEVLNVPGIADLARADNGVDLR